MKEKHIIALAGNPNVGKSTLFNNLTGMKQHTGNWPGKTVSVATGEKSTKKYSYVFTDLPGTYSLLSSSPEEDAARDYLCFSYPDAVIIVCDTTVLERNLNLVLQIREFIPRCIICLNLADEAEKKNIKADAKLLSELTDSPVVVTAARNKKGIRDLLDTLDNIWEKDSRCLITEYDTETEKIIKKTEEATNLPSDCRLNKRWIATKIIQGDRKFITALSNHLKTDLTEKAPEGIPDNLSEKLSSAFVRKAENISKQVIIRNKDADKLDRKLDKMLTGPLFGIPAMLILTALVFYITIAGANYPSQLLSDFFTYFEDKIYAVLLMIKLPEQIASMLTYGVYRILTWVISVMLPPMAIFFPLFTLLEDSGYLPRIAFNLDMPFKKCDACGKQALTMCMGFGCNACGVSGCKIIESERERLLAILTNSFVPCNGRFPALISLITMFFLTSDSMKNSCFSALILTGFILLSIMTTFAVTKFLSKTLLKGHPSSFALELPSYRKPQIGKVIVRSIFDKTATVLTRATSVAAPAGLVIWLFSNICVNGSPILNICASFLNPLGNLMGLDGIILMAFILGFPANEIVLPLIIMGYMATGNLEAISDLHEIKNILVANGWDFTTAFSTIIFILFHWPCSTTLLTVKKETGSIRMTALAAIIPTITGIMICILFNLASSLLY